MIFLSYHTLLISLVAASNLVSAGNVVAQGQQFGNSAMNRYLNPLAPLMEPLHGGPVSYKSYKGDGSTAQGWPDLKNWTDLSTMWHTNLQGLIGKACDNSDMENGQVLQAIEDVSQTTDFDPRLILAIIMQESSACVRVRTTSFSVANPGLMQSYRGKASCADPSPQTPCPASTITQMIKDGTASNPSGVDLQDLLKRANAKDSSQFYKAARMYNSGINSIGPDGDLVTTVNAATWCYASDIANRLTGYVGASACGS